MQGLLSHDTHGGKNLTFRDCFCLNMVVARVPLLGWHAYCFHIQNMVVSEDSVWVSWGEYLVLKFHIVTIPKSTFTSCFCMQRWWSQAQLSCCFHVKMIMILPTRPAPHVFHGTQDFAIPHTHTPLNYIAIFLDFVDYPNFGSYLICQVSIQIISFFYMCNL